MTTTSSFMSTPSALAVSLAAPLRISVVLITALSAGGVGEPSASADRVAPGGSRVATPGRAARGTGTREHLRAAVRWVVPAGTRRDRTLQEWMGHDFQDHADLRGLADMPVLSA